MGYDKFRYKPIVATAEKVDTTPDGKDILKVEVPFEDDGETIKSSVTNRFHKDRYGKNDTYTKDGDTEMNPDDIRRIMDEKMDEIKFNTNIQKILTHTNDVNKKINEIDNKFGGLSEKFNDLTEKQKSYIDKQNQACTGVECIKNDISKIKNDNLEKFEELNKSILDINSKLEVAVCPDCNGNIPVLSTYCPTCSKQIDEWEGYPDWKPYPKRISKK